MEGERERGFKNDLSINRDSICPNLAWISLLFIARNVCMPVQQGYNVTICLEGKPGFMVLSTDHRGKMNSRLYLIIWIFKYFFYLGKCVFVPFWKCAQLEDWFLQRCLKMLQAYSVQGTQGVWEDPWIGNTPAGKGLDPKFSRQDITKSLKKMHVLSVQCPFLEIRVYCTDPR